MIHVSFANNGIFEGTLKEGKFDFRRVGTTPEDRAWGLEFDGVNFILTGNYSSKLYWISPKSWKLVRTVNTKMKDIEDLAWDCKYLWSSSFTEWRGHIFRIHPKTGEIGPFYRLPNPEACPIIDGLAYDGKGLWITGKECPALFYSEMPK
jgi:glutamine cyclotransferase